MRTAKAQRREVRESQSFRSCDALRQDLRSSILRPFAIFQFPIRTGSMTSWTARMIDSAVSFPVLGFSLGTFSICTWSLPNSPSTSMSWQLRGSPGTARIRTRVLIRADAGQAHRARDIDVGRKSAARLARRAGKNFFLFLQANQRDAAFDQIRRAFESKRRLARRVRHMGDRADTGGLDAVQASDRPRRNIQMATGAARFRHDFGMFEQRADADHHQVFAGGEHFLRQFGNDMCRPPLRRSDPTPAPIHPATDTAADS